MPTTTIEQIDTAAAYISSRTSVRPKVGIILGTGLSGLTNLLEKVTKIAYKDIPHFPVSTVESHMGELHIGHLGKVPVVAMAGRFHYYEGYSMEQVTFPVRVMNKLGIDRLILSNAAGGVSERVAQGDLAVIRDHINLFPENPLRGKNLDSLGPRFPDLVDAYDLQMLEMALGTAAVLGIDLKPSVYVGVAGPNLETRAEFGYFKAIGADVVGMSTIPEVIVARHMGIPVLAFSVVTNEGSNPDRQPATMEEIIDVSMRAAEKLEPLVHAIVQAMYA